MIINGKQAIRMPEEGENASRFNNFHKQVPTPFVIYADFEAITHKLETNEDNDDGNLSYTKAYQNHDYGYKLVCYYDDKYGKPVQTFQGKGSVYKFMEKMLEEVEHSKKIVKEKFDKPLTMTDEEEISFKETNKCYICGNEYTKRDLRVRDHCQITGKYRGSSHKECSQKIAIKSDRLKLPVIFHNLHSYDGHLIMQRIGEISKNYAYKDSEGKLTPMKANVIPNNMEKYMAFMLGAHLTFIDSFQFMISSLDKLVSNLPKNAFKYTSEKFQDEKLRLMMRKGVYPYDYMDSFEKFDETEIPAKDLFYSILNDQHITDKEYVHAKKVRNTFNINNMGEYHDIYLKSDTLLLSDVFENFRKTCLTYYKLDPCHYFTSPGLSWDAMLKMTNIELELMTDIAMFQMIEFGLRGGVSYIANRYAKANNEYMKDYDKRRHNKHIMYLDANNLYGYAMSQALPTGNFRWLNDEEIDEINLDEFKEDNTKGLILEVDLEYPKELHDHHNDYPLAPEKMKVTNNMLSNYCKDIAEKYNISIGQVHKLIPNLQNKTKYVIHYRNLQLYVSLGLRLVKVHRALEFDQSRWLKKYIDFNNNKRKIAKNSFEKDFFKLMNNSVFGKTAENL